MNSLKRIFASPKWARFKRDMRVFIHLLPRWTIIFLLGGLVLATYLFWLAHNWWEGEITPIKALIAVVNMTFFQLTFADMPADSRLDLFPVIMPLVGLPLFSIFGLRVINIIRIFFRRSERGQEWQETLIQSTLKNHIIICGLGRVGYRVAQTLRLDHGSPLVGVEATLSPLVEILLAQDMPVILGDAANEEVLQKAGIERAKTVLVCTDRDWVNLEIAFHVRKLNSKARIILRLFEDELCETIKASFQIDAVISRSAVAALSFTYAALGAEIIETFELGQRSYVLAQVPLEAASSMLGRTIGEVSEEQDVTVVCHARGQQLTVEPAPETILQVDDSLYIFTTIAQLIPLIEHGLKRQTSAPDQGAPILVCGLGHTGYRIATNVLNLGHPVVGLDFEPGRLSERLHELGIPLKFGDFRWDSLLLEAGIEHASALVACTDNDLNNLQVAIRARALNPKIRVVMRIFDDKLGQQLRQAFGIHAVYSTSALAAPDFVSAVLDRMHIRPVDVGGLEQLIVRLEVGLSNLHNLPLIDLQREEGLTILLHARDGQIDIPPSPDARLRVKDEIVALATPTKLEELHRRNQTLQELIEEGYC